MRSPRVALVAIDPVWDDQSDEFFPFSYGVRKLEASLRSDPALAEVEVKVIDLRTPDPDAFFEAIVDFRPTLVGASLYLWSIGPFRELAARLKRWDPTLTIVAGGPHARASVFALPAYHELKKHIDAAVEGEGEEALRALVRRELSASLSTSKGRGALSAIPGLLLPHALGWRSTGPLPRVEIDAYPTPYQLDLVRDEPTGHLETFRGCPIHCTFCQWGEQRADRVHSVEYLAEHLLGLRRAGSTNILCLDAAFNLSPRAFRNLAEAERHTKVLAERTVRGHLYPTFLRDEHVELLRSFGRAHVAIGIQSFDAEVLHGLNRPFDLARFEHVCEVVREDWPIELELMLGLPGDNPASFRRTFEKAIEIADTLRVFWTLVLPDALLDRADPELAIDFDPETWLIRSCKGWSPEDLRRELDHVKAVAITHENAVVADHWAGFEVRRRAEQRPGLRPDEELKGGRLGEGSAAPIRGTRHIEPEPDRALPALDPAVVEELRGRVRVVAGWRLRTVRRQHDGLFFDLDSPEGEVTLEAVREEPSRPRFAAKEGVAYSHRGHVGREEAARLRQVIEAVHRDALPLLAGDPLAEAAPGA